MTSDLRTQPESSEAARDEIERTRARMSETIGEIEEALSRKKADLRDRFDIAARLREKPLRVAGAALAAGLLFGLLTGGRKGEDRPAEKDGRPDRWEKRARRILTIARKQQGRIDQLESAVDELWELHDSARYSEAEDQAVPSRLAEFRASVSDRIEDAAAAAARRFRDTVEQIRDR